MPLLRQSAYGSDVQISEKHPTCAICLLPVEEATMVTVVRTLVAAGQVVEEGQAERPVVIVHEDCIRPLLHPDYSL
jgi:hypothetical protein